jgi:hypothetical protein
VLFAFVVIFVDAKVRIICFPAKKKRLQKCAKGVLNTFAKELWYCLQTGPVPQDIQNDKYQYTHRCVAVTSR